MARDYIRPGLLPSFVKELLGRRIVLVNPTAEDAVRAVRDIQRGCRKNLLKERDIRDALEQLNAPERCASWDGQWTCPAPFTYGIDGTVVQAVRLESLPESTVDGATIAFYAERQSVPPNPPFPPSPKISDWPSQPTGPTQSSPRSGPTCATRKSNSRIVGRYG